MKNSSPHDSARTHVCGESIFIDDTPFMKNELHLGLFSSPVAKGRLKSLNVKEALSLPGVVQIFTHKDFHHNAWGPICEDQPLLVEDKIEFLGEPLALVAAESRQALGEALKVIKVSVEEASPVLSIDRAIDCESYLNDPQRICNGSVNEVFSEASNVLEGAFESGGQDHFYLESQAAIAYPGEGNSLEILASSQHPTETQHVVAEALGLCQHQVVCKVKRMGGAFGGKESQASHIGALAALAAYRTGRPARLVLDKDTDMTITGKRHPYKTFYKVAYSDQGEILGLKAQYFADGGAYMDLSPAILQRTLLHADNAYFLPVVEIEGRTCRTNYPPNTAFRGFGGPQGAAVIENIIEEMALKLGKDALEIRKKNCYGVDKNNRTHYGQEVKNNKLPELFHALADKCCYWQRQKEIEEFNKNSVGPVKGLSLTGAKFGISFTSRFLNQANALVNVHLDGTVQVSTGATEMGQGVNTKIQNLVSEAFGLADEQVRVMTTSTEKNHNTSATAASSGSDINGSAAMIACDKIKYRMANVARQIFDGQVSTPEKELVVDDSLDVSNIEFADGQVFLKNEASKSIGFKKLVEHLYMNRIGLGDYGFYKTKGIGFNKDTGKGTPFLYFTNGVAASEVLVDKFTGEVKVLRTDILMDLGRMINEAIDYGQVTGAFVQSMGWVTTEKLHFDDLGKLHSHSPTTYKIPNIQDTPREFNVEFIENIGNTANVRGSKAVGEPPFLLGLSVWTAVKKALAVAKPSAEPLKKLPATNEVIVRHLWADELGD